MARGAHGLTFNAKKPRFSKLILPGMVRDRQLSVPKLFAKEYGSRLSNRVVFKLPNGAEWPIRLSGSGNEIWFSEGWRQFADFYSVNSMGYFLVFEYLGNSRFLVVIYDPSASEISYPRSHVTSNGADFGGGSGGEEDNYSVEISDGYTDSLETPDEELPSDSSQEVEGYPSDSLETPDEELPSDSSQEVEGCPVNKMFWRPKPLSEAKKASALARAKAAFRSDKPFFMLAMQPSFVYAPSRCNLPLPMGFGEIYFKGNGGETVLQLSDGKRAWTVEYSVTPTTSKNRVFFRYHSWLTFAKDTNLQVGDVCAFELVKGGTTLTLEVTILRAAQRSGSSADGNGGACRRRTLSAGLPGGVPRRNMQSSKQEENQSSIFGSSSEAAIPFTSVNPVFKVHIGLYHVQRNNRRCTWRVIIPKEFASNIDKRARKAKLWVEGSCWPVNLRRELRGETELVVLGGGWRRFAEENSVEVGNVCVFELIGTEENGSSKTVKFNVNISRGE